MPVLPLQPLPISSAPRDDFALKLFEAAIEGARTLMMFWGGAISRERKADGTFVSEADHAADRSVREALHRMGVDMPLVSEESDVHRAASDETFLMLDPLDGTSEFLDHTPEFCVCLAAIHKGHAVAGAIVAPALKRGWYAGETCFAVALDEGCGRAAEPELIRLDERPLSADCQALVSRRHSDGRSETAMRLCGASAMVRASSAIKFGLLAEGKADLHVRYGQTMAWDIAAGDAILTAAGGLVRTLAGEPMAYAGEGDSFRNPPFVAVARAGTIRQVLDVVQRVS